MMVSSKRLEKLSNPEYRRAYLSEVTKGWVVLQLKAMRDQRNWTQADLAARMGKPQSAIARMESESYGNWGTNTLLELAAAFDVALEIKFVSWPALILDTTDSSPAAMHVPSFSASAFYPANAYQRPPSQTLGFPDQTFKPSELANTRERHAREPTPTPLSQHSGVSFQLGAS